MIEQTDAKHQIVRPGAHNLAILNVGMFELDSRMAAPRLLGVFRAPLEAGHIEPQFLQEAGKISDSATYVRDGFNLEPAAQILKDRPQKGLPRSDESPSVLLIEDEFTAQLSLPRAPRACKAFSIHHGYAKQATDSRSISEIHFPR